MNKEAEEADATPLPGAERLKEERRRYAEAGNDLDDAIRAVNQWKADHDGDGFSPLHHELVHLQKMVTDANQRLNEAEKRYKDARAAAVTAAGNSRDQLVACCHFAQLLIQCTLMCPPTSISNHNQDFKRKLCQFYKCYRRKKSWIRCMVLDMPFPKSFVTAAHLFRNSNMYIANYLMKIHDIDDTRNGMLMFTPLACAFDHFQLSFIRCDDGLFKLKLFDQSIRENKLIDLINDADTLQDLMDSVSVADPSKRCHFDLSLTFGQIDGKRIRFHPVNRPFNRCLNLQARLAHMNAFEQGWVDDSYQFNDFWSDGMSLEDKMGMLQNSSLVNDEDPESERHHY